MIGQNESQQTENHDQRLGDDHHYLSNYTYSTSQQPLLVSNNEALKPAVTFQVFEIPQLKLKTQQIILETIHGVIMQKIIAISDQNEFQSVSYEQFLGNLKQVKDQHYFYPNNVLDFDINLVNQWTQQITDMALTQLVVMCQPFKWIVNCFILEDKANQQQEFWSEACTEDNSENYKNDFSYDTRVDFSKT